MAVIVLDRRKKPLDPCSEKRARKMLKAGRARVHSLRPFAIRLVDRTVEDGVVHAPTAVRRSDADDVRIGEGDSDQGDSWKD